MINFLKDFNLPSIKLDNKHGNLFDIFSEKNILYLKVFFINFNSGKEKKMAKKTEAEAIKNFLDDLMGQAHSMLSKGVARTEKAAQSAKTKLDLHILNSKKGDLLYKLGEEFYASTKRKKPSPKRQQAIMSVLQEIKEIDAYEKQLKKAVKEAARPKAKKAARRGRPPGKKKAATKAKKTA
jgi:hypothetical protein